MGNAAAAAGPAVWHEVHRVEDGVKFCGSGSTVFLTNQLGDALNQAFRISVDSVTSQKCARRLEFPNFYRIGHLTTGSFFGNQAVRIFFFSMRKPLTAALGQPSSGAGAG